MSNRNTYFREYMREYRARNKEHCSEVARASSALWREQNREALNSRSREYMRKRRAALIGNTAEYAGDFEQFASQIGEAIKDLRNRSGMTQWNVADGCGIEQSTVTRAERGVQNLTLSTLCQLCDSMGLRLEMRLALKTQRKEDPR